MRRMMIVISAGLLAAAGAFSQSMMSTSSSSSDAGSMTASAMADPKVGHELRMAPSTGRKVLFTTLAAAEAFTSNGPVVLFFAADWCPYCQADLKEINADGAKLKDITVVVLDYDKEKALRRQYAVTVQDTFVQIDAKGTSLTAWNGGGVDGILQHVTRG